MKSITLFTLALCALSLSSTQKFYTSDNGNLYKSGFFKGEVKDSTWLTLFEDYPLPKFEYYKDGSSLKGMYSFDLRDEQGRPWVKGELITHPELTTREGHKNLGHINYFDYPAHQHTYQYYYAAGSNYSNDSDSLIVITKLYDSKSNKLIWKSASLHWNTEEFKPVRNLDSLERALHFRP